jgi:hypothetical protein
LSIPVRLENLPELILDMLLLDRMAKSMKTTKALFVIVTITAGLAMNGRSQVYQLSTPITGYMTMSVQDTNGPAGSSASCNYNFTNLAETIYLDVVAQTIRQVGVISGTPSAGNISFTETQQIPGEFPKPPTSVTGSVTVTLAPSDGGLSFDTGPEALTWTSTVESYTFDGDIQNFPMNGSYSLLSGVYSYTGTFAYTLPMFLAGWDHAVTFTALSTINYPTSLSLTGLGIVPACCGGRYAANPPVSADITCPNGFHLCLSVGITWNGDGYGEYFTWDSPGTIMATLAATNSPAITMQPQGQIVTAYTNTEFSVSVIGTPPLSYQWSFNGTNIAGATSSSLAISNVTRSDLGSYAVVVSSPLGSATSSNAVLSMYPYIAFPFTGAETYWGKDATFNVDAWGTGPLSYQWFQNGSAILNATNRSLTLTNIQFTNAGLYSVVIRSALGSATNTPEQVIVNPAGVSLGLYPGVTINGVVGYSYIIQRAADLSNTNSWVTMTNVTLTQPVQLWVDTNIDASLPYNGHYFYQVLPGP